MKGHIGMIRMIGLALWLSIMPITSCLASADAGREDIRYYNAVELFNQKKWKAAQEACELFKKQYPDSKWIAGIELRLADMAESPYRAIKGYEKVLTMPGINQDWVDDARWGLATTYFTLGQYDKCIPLLNEMTLTGSGRQDQSGYLLGLSHLALNNFQEAKQIFHKVLNNSKNRQWKENALVGLADAEFGLKQYSEARLLYERYEREYADGRHENHVLEQKSKLLTLQGSGEDATQTMHRLVTLYPDSFEAEKIKSKLSTEANAQKFTVQVGAFSKPAYADSLVKRLRAKGYNAYRLKARHNDDIFIQVRVGHYTSKSFAEKIGEKIKQKENLPYVIVTYIKPE